MMAPKTNMLTVALFFLSLLLAQLPDAVLGELCDPSTDRHCQPFPEKNVESSDMVLPNEVAIAAEPDEQTDDAGSGTDGGNTSSSGTGSTEPIDTPVTSRSGGGDNGRLRTGGIVAVTVGGAVLLVAAAAVRRRRQAAALEDGVLSGLSSAGPSQSADGV